MKPCWQVRGGCENALQRHSKNLTSFCWANKYWFRRLFSTTLWARGALGSNIRYNILVEKMRVRKQLSICRPSGTLVRTFFSSTDTSLPLTSAEDDISASIVEEVSVDAIPDSVVYSTIPLCATDVHTWKIGKVAMHNGLPPLADIALVDTRKMKKGHRALPRPRIKRIRQEYEKHWADTAHQEPRFLVILVKTDLGRTALAKKLLDSLSDLLTGVERISIAVLVARRSHTVGHLFVKHSAEELPPPPISKEAAASSTSVKLKGSQSDALQREPVEERNMEPEHPVENQVMSILSIVSQDSEQMMNKGDNMVTKGSGDVPLHSAERRSTVERAEVADPLEQSNGSREQITANLSSSEREKLKFDQFLQDLEKESSELATGSKTEKKSNEIASSVNNNCTSHNKYPSSEGSEKQVATMGNREQRMELFEDESIADEIEEESDDELGETLLGAAPEGEGDGLDLSYLSPYKLPPEQPKDEPDDIHSVQEDFDEEKKVKNDSVHSLESETSEISDTVGPITPLPPRFIDEEMRYSEALHPPLPSSSSIHLDISEEEIVHPDIAEAVSSASSAEVAAMVDAELKEDEKILPEVVEEMPSPIEINQGEGDVAPAPPHMKSVGALDGSHSALESSGLPFDHSGSGEAQKMNSKSPQGISDIRTVYTRGKEDFAYFSSTAVSCRLMASSTVQSQQSAHLIDTSPFLPFFSYTFASNSMERKVVKVKHRLDHSSFGLESLEKKKLSEGQKLSQVPREDHRHSEVEELISLSGEKGDEIEQGQGDSGNQRTSIVVETVDQFKNKIKHVFPRVVHKSKSTQQELLLKEVENISSPGAPISLSLSSSRVPSLFDLDQATKCEESKTAVDEKAKIVSHPKKIDIESTAGDLVNRLPDLPTEMAANPPSLPSSNPSLEPPLESGPPTEKEASVESEGASVISHPAISAKLSSHQKLVLKSGKKVRSIKGLKIKNMDSSDPCRGHHPRSSSKLKTVKRSNPRHKKLSKILSKISSNNPEVSTKKTQNAVVDFAGDNSLSAQLSRRLREELRQRSLKKKMQKMIEKKKRQKYETEALAQEELVASIEGNNIRNKQSSKEKE